MERKDIEFRKPRDFGEKFNATFEFLRLEFKPLFKGILYVAGPFIAIAGILDAYYQKYSLSLLDFTSDNPVEFFTRDLGISAAGLFISSVLAYILTFAVVSEYVKIYMDTGNKSVDINPLRRAVRKNLLHYFGSAFGYFILIVLVFFVTGTLLVGIVTLDILLLNIFVFLGFFLLIFLITILFYITFISYNLENPDFLGAGLRSLRLLKGNWMSTLGLLIVAWIFVTIANIIFTLPNAILTMVGIFHRIDDNDAVQLSFFEELAYGFTSFIASAGGYFLTVILMLILIFQYFNLVEKLDATGLIQRIEEMGTKSNEGDDEDF